MKKEIEVEKLGVNNKLEDVNKLIYKLNLMFLKSEEKVAYYYEDMNGTHSIGFNPNTCFYAASTIKILVAIYIYEFATKGKLDLNELLRIEENDIKRGNGELNKRITPYNISIEDLVYHSIKYSDNTAYIKLVDYVGFDRLLEYGLSLGATHTLEGKDHFGLINCRDAIIYLKKMNELIASYPKETELLREALINPSIKIINQENILRKFGSFDIAYHEIGIVNDNYYLIILTQKNKRKNKKQFINKAATIIDEIHVKLQKMELE